MHSQRTIGTALLLTFGVAAAALGAEARAPEKVPNAEAMKACVAQEQQRNNTGKAAAEVTCKEMREVQQETESNPAERPVPSSPTSDGASAAGHSSHSGVSGAQPARQSAPAERAPTTSK